MKNKAPVFLPCPYCGGKATAKDSVVIYRVRSYGTAYICENYPVCETFVGCHKGSSIPLGTLANKPLRELRKRCHKLFDPLWLSGDMTRRQAYRWLQDNLGISEEQAHISRLTTDQCENLLSILTR